MEHALLRLQEAGIRRVGATLSYRAEQIQRYFGDRLRYFVEDEPQGTAGSLRAAGISWTKASWSFPGTP